MNPNWEGDGTVNQAQRLSSECLVMVFAHLPPVTLARCMLVNRQWRDVLTREDDLWRLQCKAIYSLDCTVGPELEELPTFRATCGRWHPFCLRYGPLGLRSLRAWAQIQSWLERNAPEIAASLRPGASEAALREAELQLGVTLPSALRALYSIHDGQSLEFDRQIDGRRPTMGPSVFHGLFGGYSFYSHLVSVRMLPLHRVVTWTLHQRDKQGLPPGDPGILFAAGFNFNKLLYVRADTGGVVISHVPAVLDVRAVPSTAWSEDLASRAGYSFTFRKTCLDADADGVLQWFEAYAESLTAGCFAIEDIYPEVPYSRGICLFPRIPEFATVTRSIKVTASPLFIPELSQLDRNAVDVLYFFAYSIRFSLTAQDLGDQGSEPPFSSVQLLDRRWLIRNAAGLVESEVQGEGVVGQYPILVHGGPEFAYQSCTHQREPEGSMEGEFTFVEGTSAAPGPRQVKAVCPKLQLQVPPIVF